MYTADFSDVWAQRPGWFHRVVCVNHYHCRVLGGRPPRIRGPCAGVPVPPDQISVNVDHRVPESLEERAGSRVPGQQGAQVRRLCGRPGARRHPVDQRRGHHVHGGQSQSAWQRRPLAFGKQRFHDDNVEPPAAKETCTNETFQQ